MHEPMGPKYWRKYSDGVGAWGKLGLAPGEHLAALRKGAGREPLSVPEMWPFLTEFDERFADPARDRWAPSYEAAAEHYALVLYGIHQQSQPLPVHRSRVGVGRALRALVASSRYSDDALDRRFHAAITADSSSELAWHLRGLVRMLRTVGGVPEAGAGEVMAGRTIGLDYDWLYLDLYRWSFPERRIGVRRRWSGDYFYRSRPDASESILVTNDES